jgi:hypothetical protein
MRTIAAVALFLVAAIVIDQGQFHPQSADAQAIPAAPQPPTVLQQQCSVTKPGTVLVPFQWQPSGEGSQWLDLSLVDNGFAPGSYVGVGPLPPGSSTFAWDGLVSAMPHYVRVNTSTPTGWLSSQTLAFTTGVCGGPAALDQPIQACGGQAGVVNATFKWKTPVPPGSVQWLDLSLVDNGFAPGTFVSAGPLDPAATTFGWTGLQAGVAHFWRVNTLTSTGWQPSSPGSLVTGSCPEGRAPGQVRTLAAGLTDQLVCYQLGQTDAAQDRAAGVTLQVTTPWPWEPGSVTAQVKLGEGTSVACGEAYVDGYTGVQFQQR